jgi:2',3'-cyclic-nucleotide 2'-phosphodiesterase (5'-nucleotidase family)
VEAERALAAKVPGIDVIIGGHSHTALSHPIRVFNGLNENGWDGTAVAQAGYYGEYLGRTVVYFEDRRPVRFSGALLPVLPAEGEDPVVESLLRPYRDSIEVAMSSPVFRSPERVPSTGLRDGETALGDFVADVIRDAAGADVGLINSGGIRAAIPAGEVTVGDVYTVLPFDNRIVVVSMPGWQLRELFDFTASRLGKGGFAQISGAKYVIHGTRSAYVRVGGEILDSNREYRVATVDYLYYGGDGYTIFKKTSGVEQTGILLREAAVRFLRRNPGYPFQKEGRIVWEGSTRPLGGGRR